MTAVEFLLPDGSVMRVEAKYARETVMEVAIRAGVPGIIGDCGGNASCATCHVHVEPEWRDAVGPASPLELDLIDLTEDPQPESRLACQIWLTEELDGLRLRPAPN